MVNSKKKGARGERDCSQFLREHGFDSARRGVQYSGGPESPDVVGVPGVHIEVKFTEALRLYDALDQSKRDAGKYEIPVVFQDERLSTVSAEKMLIEGNVRREKRKQLIDAVAATIILQNYLDKPKKS